MSVIPLKSKVAIIAPSAQVADKKKLRSGINYLRSLGFEPQYGKHLFLQQRYMAGTDEQRAQDVNAAFADKEIKAVFCARAAAGATRILKFLDYKLIAANPKPLIGFCDNAALQIALNKYCSLVSWNGFSLTYDFKSDNLNPLIDKSFRTLLAGKPYQICSGKCLQSSTAQGQLICVNLSTLMYLAGTQYFPDLNGKILLIEDVHERLHKIDLMLQQLKQQPSFSKLKGIIFGKFTDCSGDEEDGNLADCIADFIKSANVPVITDFEFGHTPARFVLPLGAKVEMCADSATLKILSY